MFNFTILGGTNVHGKFKPEKKNTYATIIGDHTIDLSEAELSPDMPVKITICKFIGNAKVIVPPNTRISVGGLTVIGNKKTSVDPGDDALVIDVRVSYNCILGNLRVASQD